MKKFITLSVFLLFSQLGYSQQPGLVLPNHYQPIKPPVQQQYRPYGLYQVPPYYFYQFQYFYSYRYVVPYNYGYPYYNPNYNPFWLSIR